MNKYEQLIEYVINEEDAKAEELFHEIVVEKSREIYESLMDEEEQVEENFEGVREDDEEEMEMPGDEMDMEPEMGDEMEIGDEAGEEELEDRVVDLEDQMDALMAEFDELMAGEMEEPEHAEMDFDAEPEMGDEEMPMEAAEDTESLEEAVKLEKVSKGIAGTTEGDSVGSGSESVAVNKKTPMAHNSGKKGSVAKPHQEVGEEEGRSAPEVKDGDSTTEPRESRVKEPKKTGEDSGTNKKSIQGS